MNGYSRRYGWALAFGGVLLATLVAGIAYTMGVSQGANYEGAGMVHHGWHRPWGPFAFFPLLVFAFLWMGLLRAFFWGGHWRGPWRRRYYPEWDDAQASFDEWHRRSHERMKEPPPADDPDRRG